MTSVLWLIETFQRKKFRRNYLQNKKLFLVISLHFWNLYYFLNIFEKKMTLIAHTFPNLRTPKNVVRQMSKKSRFRGVFDKQHCKWVHTLLKSERQHVYHIYWSLTRRLSWKNLLLGKCKILRQFVNTLTADDKCSLLSRDNLTEPI